MSTDLYYDDTNGISDSNITIEINGAKCVITCVDGKLHAEGVIDVGAQGLFEQVCEMWNTRTPQWQPIETAPRDGTHILGYWKTMRITDYPAVLYKDDCFLNPNAFSFVGKVELEEVFPTHWMPVPTPPNKEQP